MTTEHGNEERRDDSWERVGRAAEVFARRMARDARTFVERMEEHAGDFARDVKREWPCGGGRHRHRHQARPAADVRGIFEDVRTILSDVAEGVDEMLARIFPETEPAPWTRVVTNREAACGGCGKPIASGTDAHVRRTAGGTEFRCVACGVPGA